MHLLIAAAFAFQYVGQLIALKLFECAALRKQCLFWYNIWVSCGRPKVGDVADNMCSMHRKYHFAVKDLTAT